MGSLGKGGGAMRRLVDVLSLVAGMESRSLEP
jgi:hypothetical protein